MDITTIGGLLLGIGSVLLAYSMEGGQLSAVFQAPAMILVIFGTFGAAIVTTSVDTLRSIPSLIRIAFRKKEPDPRVIVDQIGEMSERARRNGILGIEGYIKRIENPFFQQALKLVVDGTEMTALKGLLETEIDNLTERHQAGILLFRKLGGFSPTMGIIGTVLGLIQSLANAGDTSQMASSIATAFIATLWGVALANLVYLPISDKLKRKHDAEVHTLRLILEGMIAIQSGENPRVIRSKLSSFVVPEKRQYVY
ncbi:MAG: motility protein A [candidate division Zixibacteria bacterium]|nr:motility protein A [candidate division Zixibacteria bacterium]